MNLRTMSANNGIRIRFIELLLIVLSLLAWSNSARAGGPEDGPGDEDIILTGERGGVADETRPAPTPVSRHSAPTPVLGSAGLGLATAAGLAAGLPIASALIKSLHLISWGSRAPLIAGFATLAVTALAANAIYQQMVSGKVDSKRLFGTTASVIAGASLGLRLGLPAAVLGALIGGQVGTALSR